MYAPAGDAPFPLVGLDPGPAGGECGIECGIAIGGGIGKCGMSLLGCGLLCRLNNGAAPRNASISRSSRSGGGVSVSSASLSPATQLAAICTSTAFSSVK